ncbi:MAG: branched-chain amino acid ABC transporter substrate-binding protein [Chloroflexota bacterium]
MKRLIALPLLLIMLSLPLAACSSQPYTCTDGLGCVEIGPDQDIEIAALLTFSGADAPYGIDALRGVQIALDEKGKVLGHNIQLIEQDDLCTEQGGIDGATALAANKQIVGVIGATCSGGSLPASKILSEAGMVLISPSSTAPSLTEEVTHQPGFLRAIYNDKAQGKAVAEFAYNILNVRRMATIHDGTPYPEQLQAAACESFERLGGKCIAQFEVASGKDVTSTLGYLSLMNPEVLYFPVYTAEGIAITNAVDAAGLINTSLISSDSLVSTDFLEATKQASEGMYLSGPAPVPEAGDFMETYVKRFGEEPIAAYHLNGYDAALMLVTAIEKVGVKSGNTVYIPRQALREALYNLRGLQGKNGIITCSPSGDCASPNIQIFQVVDQEFLPIYP